MMKIYYKKYSKELEFPINAEAYVQSQVQKKTRNLVVQNDFEEDVNDAANTSQKHATDRLIHI